MRRSTALWLAFFVGGISGIIAASIDVDWVPSAAGAVGGALILGLEYFLSRKERTP